MDVLLEELTAGLSDMDQIVRMAIRLIAATVLGGIIGFERERIGKAAGLRTHMLTALGSALFVVSAAEAGMSIGDMSRVIQGLATGIGFIGGGAILKLAQEREIEGLTTSAGIWMTAAVGVAVGLGRLWTAVLSMLLGWIILRIVGSIEFRLARRRSAPSDDKRP
jgi:putative Mg2+ transporter-C (MgtC) family protein